MSSISSLPGFPRLKNHVAAAEAKVSPGRRSAASRTASAALMTDFVGYGILPEQARLCPKRPPRNIGTLDDADNFAKFRGYGRHLAEGFKGAENLRLKVSRGNRLPIFSKTCWLQIVCRIFGQFVVLNHGLCCSRPRSVPPHVRTCRRT